LEKNDEKKLIQKRIELMIIIMKGMIFLIKMEKKMMEGMVIKMGADKIMMKKYLSKY